MVAIPKKRADSREGHMAKVTSVCALVLMMGLQGFAQERPLTIRERLAQSGGSATFGAIMPSGVAPKISDLLPQVDLAARGMVGVPKTYISDDESEVFTDYPIENPVILLRSTTAAAPKVGVPEDPTVTIFGGQVTVDGLVYKYIAEALPSLEPGTECIFLLQHYQGRYFPVGKYYGVFRVTGGGLRAVAKKQGFGDEIRTIRSSEAVSEIVKALRDRERR